MAVSNGYRAQQAPKIMLETVAPDRNTLRSQLVALYHQYASDVENAEAIQKEYEQLIRDAKRERRAAMSRIDKLRQLLDDEFPGWESPILSLDRCE
jgi:hypothetical protein